MNYGKNNTKKQQKKLSNKNTKAKKRFGVVFLKTLFICILSVILISLIGFGFYTKHLIDQCPDISDVNISPTGYSTTVLDSDGNEIETLASSGANREYVTLNDIPVNLQHAFVAIEDERFYTHNGIDIKGIIRAGVTGITNGFHFSQGASTITQQLLKNNYFTTWTSESTMLDRVNRKIQEQYLAVQLEKATDKDTILENYLNTINLGQNTLGVQAAANRYFNKPVSELTLSECAVIAAITQNPSGYNPISHPQQNAKRMKKVLDGMLKYNYITQAEYDKALSDDVYDRIQIVNNETVASGSTSYFVDALTDEIIDDLIEEKGYSETEAYRTLYAGGLTIYSTQKTDLQKIVDEEINNPDNYGSNLSYSFNYRLTVTKADGSTKNYSEQTMLSYYQSQNANYDINFSSKEAAQEAIDKYKSDIMEEGDTIGEGCETITFTLQPQTAMTVIDQSTGSVVALCGGRGDKTASKTLNRATNVTRQPGSTFKIIAAYAGALDAGGLTLASVEDDSPMTYANGTPLRNYDKSYRGFTTLREGITYSINVVTVKALTEVGTGLGFQYAQDLGISTLTSGDNNQSLALGGITNGVTNLELCNAYATIANGGTYNKPIFYTKIIDHNGDVLLDNTENVSKQVLKPTTAWLLTSAMQDVMTKGTGGAANFSNMAVAGKSGTTTKNRDTVFAGFTPYYTATIWGGYDDNAVQSNTSYSKRIWKQVMSRIHSDLSYKDFKQPSGITTATVCKKSGKLAIEGVCDCDPRGSMVYTEYFASGTAPTETCDHHVQARICTVSNMTANEYCPADCVKEGVFIIGGSEGNADSEYLVTEDMLNNVCNVHTAPAAPTPDSSNTQPSSTDDKTLADQIHDILTEGSQGTSGTDTNTNGNTQQQQ